MIFTGLKLQNKDYAIEITCGLKRLKYFHLVPYREFADCWSSVMAVEMPRQLPLTRTLPSQSVPNVEISFLVIILQCSDSQMFLYIYFIHIQNIFHQQYFSSQMSHVKRERGTLRTTASLPPFSIVYNNANVNFDLSMNISVMWLFLPGFQVKKKTILMSFKNIYFWSR